MKHPEDDEQEAQTIPHKQVIEFADGIRAEMDGCLPFDREALEASARMFMATHPKLGEQ